MESPKPVFHWLDLVSISSCVCAPASNHCLHFSSTKHTTEKASPHGTVPGNDWRWKPVGRRLLNRVSVWLIDTPEIQLPCQGNGCRYKAEAPQRVWNAHIQVKRPSRFCLSVRGFQQFPYRRIRSAILALIRRVVEDLESRCLQIYTAAMSLSGKNKEGEVWESACTCDSIMPTVLLISGTRCFSCQGL